jgi:AcrR family transcriptional regulator
MADSRGGRKKRSNGEASRLRILGAAAEIAGERGYEGTSIALVSAKCGLPASSIYWHFKNKDDLLAAVIERSFGVWLDALALPGDLPPGFSYDLIDTLAAQIGKALLEHSDFLRLGLMLVLERRPVEPSARIMFRKVRHTAHERIAELFSQFAPDLDHDTIRLLTTYAVAAADGLFIAKEIGGDDVDLIRLFEVHARALYDLITRLTGAPPAG